QRSWIDGYLIETASSGSPSITLDSSESARIGDFEGASTSDPIPVLLENWDVQPAGYPPNFQWYELNYVTACDEGTRVLTLRNLTQYRYSADTPDRTLGTISVGAARVRKLTGRTSD